MWHACFAAILLTLDVPAGPHSAEAWTTVPLVTEGPLTVRLKVRPRASLADEQWLGFEFENSSDEPVAFEHCDIRYRIGSKRFNLHTGALISSDGLGSGTCFDLFPKAWESARVSPVTFPPGITSVFEDPSNSAAASLGMPGHDGLKVSSRVYFDLRVSRDYDKTGTPFTFEWVFPDDQGILAIRSRLRQLVTNPPVPFHSSQYYITHALLRIPEVNTAVSLEELLGALDQEKNRSSRNTMAKYIADRFPNHPDVIKYYRTRLKEKNDAATEDLGFDVAEWHDEYLPPLLRISEDENWRVARLALEAVSRHRDRWPDPESIASCLSAAVLAKCPLLSKHPADLSERELINEWPEHARALAMTGDSSVIPMLCPYLDVRAELIDIRYWAPITFFPSGVPALRVCDVALESILKLQGRAPGLAYKEEAQERGMQPFHSSSRPANTPAPATSQASNYDRDDYYADLESSMNRLRDEMIAELKKHQDCRTQ
jgi:hypothetical protein